jgi:hypothetical protein
MMKRELDVSLDTELVGSAPDFYGSSLGSNSAFSQKSKQK